MNNPSTIRKAIEDQFNSLLKSRPIIPQLNNPSAYGHSAGDVIEEWVKSQLIINKWVVYSPNDFLSNIFNLLKEPVKIVEFLDKMWWRKLLVSKGHLTDFNDSKPIKKRQQEGADLVLFYGVDIIKDCDKIILINTKSHEDSRKSRDPNIMSAQRLVEYFNYIASNTNREDMLKSAELWFLGVDYTVSSNGGLVQKVNIKDLFKLDVVKIPQINFDAAIQIQWHVGNMVEKSQTKKEFVLDLAGEFMKRWIKHSQSKQTKYERIVQSIQTNLSN